MPTIRSRGEQIRSFIVNHVEAHPQDIARVTAEKFGITRQAVNKHLQKLVDERALTTQGGRTRSRAYRLAALVEWSKTYRLTPDLAEDVVWRTDVAPALGNLPANVLNIWHYGFTEMFNNAVDHSEGKRVDVHLIHTAALTEIHIHDDGVGIFRKIQNSLGLIDERHAVLELSKGKLTTDPSRHTGEGIFFTSRMLEGFEILSGNTYFSHEVNQPEDWVLERDNPRDTKGTTVFMSLHNHTARSTAKVFSQFTSGEDPGFNKTVVPVRLAQYGQEQLISRSQAKRLLTRVDRFKTVMLDFTDVKTIGHAFADEIFRVFRRAHPEIELYATQANTEVQQMISRVESA